MAPTYEPLPTTELDDTSPQLTLHNPSYKDSYTYKQYRRYLRNLLFGIAFCVVAYGFYKAGQWSVLKDDSQQVIKDPAPAIPTTTPTTETPETNISTDVKGNNNNMGDQEGTPDGYGKGKYSVG